MMIKPQHVLSVFCGIFLWSSMFGTAHASMVIGWWGGNWSCKIDGRPARMKWQAVDDSRTVCNDTSEGRVCSRTSGVRWDGSFSDNGSAWVPLKNPNQDNNGGFYFHHADGNLWHLAKPNGNRTSGWTTWNGRRYPLSCWK